MKSQIGIEFLMGVTILLIVYIGSIGFFSQYAQTQLIETELAKQVCYKISTGLDSAVVGGSNFIINQTLPDNIEGNEYNFRINIIPTFINETHYINRTFISVVWDNNESMVSCNNPFFPLETETVNATFECTRIYVENDGKRIDVGCLN